MPNERGGHFGLCISMVFLGILFEVLGVQNIVPMAPRCRQDIGTHQ